MRAKSLIKLSPLLGPFLLLFVGGFALAVLQSFGLLTPLPPGGGAADGYAMLASRVFLVNLGFTAYVALVSALLAVCAGSVLGYALWRLPERLKGVALVYKVPLILPHIAVAFVVLVLFTQSGFLSSITNALGLTKAPADFPPLLFAGNGLGLILAYAYKGAPFVMLLCLSSLARLDRRLPDSARMLGAGPFRTFTRVGLPHLSPVLHTSFIILFLYAFGAFDIPYLLSESYPGMLSVVVFNLYFKRDLIHRPEAMAMLVAMFAFSTVFIFAYTKWVGRVGRGARKL